ncbi:MAG: TRAP transporter large permease subunit [Dehalococcoidia bacterium]|jgi:tripartite ATP-independent transporter DctM subunit|nr:TRAP transporter large permease subunit [Dehalococcoidia bacterium]
MIDLSPELAAILMLGGIFVGVLLGYPLAISIGGVGIVIGLLAFGPRIAGELYYGRFYSGLENYVLLAVPLFIFMGIMLEHSGVAEGMYDALYLSFGGLRGGLAITTVLIGTVVAACVGIIGASVTMLALIALPAMINRGYDRSLAAGCVAGGGSLGILIPPSVMLVVYGPMANLSVGRLFFGAFIPGFLLSAMYIAYIVVRCIIQPNLAPPVPAAERSQPASVKLYKLLKSMLPPTLLILAVLGSIFFGVAAPTEAAGVGALAATLLAIGYRKLTWPILKQTAMDTVRTSGMVLLIGAMAFAFVGIFMRANCDDVVTRFLLAAPGGKWGMFMIVMIICFLLGFLIDWLGIIFIMVPIVTPVAAAAGFDALWFAMMICVNLQMSFMTPPFAYALFYIKGAVDPKLNVTTGQIISGMIPYVFIIVIALILCIIFPQIILWLPGKML